MRTKPPVRAVATLVLKGGTSDVDIKVYKKCDQITGIGLQRHMYHAEDMGQVCRQDVCSVCEQVLEPDQIVRLASLDEALVQVDKETVRKAWQVSNVATIVACPDQIKFTTALMNDTVCILGSYVIGPVDAFDERDLDAILGALKKLNKVAVIDLPLNNQMRRGVLLPNGTIYTLYYENEIRSQRDKLRKNSRVTAEMIAFVAAKLAKRRNSIGKAIPKVDLEKIWDDLAEGA